MNKLRAFIAKRPILSVAVLGVLALGSIFYGSLIVFNAAEVPGGPNASYCYSKGACQLALRPENVKKLAKVMNFPFLDRRNNTRLDRSVHILLTRQTESVPPYLPGTPSSGTVFPRGDQRIIDFSINCMYPPVLVNQTIVGQVVGNAVSPLPAFCYVPPDVPQPSIPLPAECSRLDQKPVGAVPVALSPGCLNYDLGTRDGATITVPHLIGAVRVALDSTSAGEFWGSGFVVGTDYFLTSCHSLYALFNAKSSSYGSASDRDTLRPGVNLYVDFSVDQKYPMEVNATFLTCASKRGLDVALLKLGARSTTPNNSATFAIPNPIPLLYEPDWSVTMTAKPTAFVAYGDLRHPIDEPTSEMYYPVSNGSDPGAFQKFAMWDPVVGKSKCFDVKYLLDDASSTVGSSGGLVVDVFKDYDENNPTLTLRSQPLAAGVHKCCSAYFDNDQGVNEEEQSCTWMHRTPFNQDVSSTSILEEPNFCSYLKDKVSILDNSGNSYNLVCNGSNVNINKKL